jgi:hypothetical protein
MRSIEKREEVEDTAVMVLMLIRDMVKQVVLLRIIQWDRTRQE